MSKCDYCYHVEMCGWRENLEERGCDFFDDGNKLILNKIKAEIIEMRSKQNVGVTECLDIIDKYIAESEDKE